MCICASSFDGEIVYSTYDSVWYNVNITDGEREGGKDNCHWHVQNTFCNNK